MIIFFVPLLSLVSAGLFVGLFLVFGPVLMILLMIFMGLALSSKPKPPINQAADWYRWSVKGSEEYHRRMARQKGGRA